MDAPRVAPAGSLGPRLAGRLTAELILRCPQYMSPLKQYEIDLRGNKIAAIENLGATENQFDSIDLSDNSIVRLEGFPRLLRLKQLLLHNNRIARIGKTCHEPVPNLEVLMLTNNKLSNLQDLDPLAGFKHLTMLSLIGNPVVTKPNYRLYVIQKCKALKVLDFKKVKQQERVDAAKLFPTEAEAAAHGAKTFEVDAEFEAQQAALAAQQPQQQAAPAAQSEAAAATAEPSKKGPTAEDMLTIKAAIANATTMDEIRRLEQALTTGHLPSEFVMDVSTSGDGPTAQGPGQGSAQTEDAVMADVHENGAPAAGAEPAAGGTAENGTKPEEMAVG